jgi:hypothetical protein
VYRGVINMDRPEAGIAKSEIAKGRQGRRRTPNYENQNECSAGARNTSAQVGGALREFLAVRTCFDFSPHSLHRRELGSTDCQEEPDFQGFT